MKRLAGYEKNSTIPLAVLTKCKNVTDRRTDGQDGQTDNRVRTSRSYNGSHMDHVTITQLHISAGIHWIAPPPESKPVDLSTKIVIIDYVFGYLSMCQT